MIRLLISEPSLLLKAKLNEYTNAIVEHKDEFNYSVFDFEETPLVDIIDALQSPSFGSDKKVVICKNPYFIKDEKLKLPFTNDLKKLEEYLMNPNPDSEFILICPKKYYLPKSKFINTFLKYGQVENLLFEDENDFHNYGNHLIKSAHIQIDQQAAAILFERCLNDVCKLEREIAKLALYNEPIDAKLIQKFVSKPLEDDVFELSNALLSKNHKKIMQVYNDLKLLKVEPIYLISLLANQFRLMLQSSILKKANYLDDQIATTLNVHPYRVKLALKNSRNYSLNAIKNILINLSDLDAKIKTGELDRYVDFELFLATQ